MSALAPYDLVPVACVSNDSLRPLAETLKGTGYSCTTVTPATHAHGNTGMQNAWARSATDVFSRGRPFREGVQTPQLFEAMRHAEVLDRYGEGWVSLVLASTPGGLLFLHLVYPTTASDADFFEPDSYRFVNASSEHHGTDRSRASVAPLLSASCLEWHHQELDPDVFGEELTEPARAQVERIAAVPLTVHRVRA